MGVYLAVTLAKKAQLSNTKLPLRCFCIGGDCLPCCHLIAHRNRSAVPLPIFLQSLPIAAVAIHPNHAASVHCDCRCRPSHVASSCATSVSAAIICRQLCRPSCHRHLVAHCNCFAVLLPIAPLSLPRAAWAALRVSYSQCRPLRV